MKVSYWLLEKMMFFSIEPKWTKNHNIFLFQKENDLYIDKPSIISYLDNFLLLNDNIKIISCNVTILANDNCTINEMNEIYDKYDRKYFYEAKIVCNKNGKQCFTYIDLCGSFQQC